MIPPTVPPVSLLPFSSLRSMFDTVPMFWPAIAPVYWLPAMDNGSRLIFFTVPPLPMTPNSPELLYTADCMVRPSIRWLPPSSVP
ncbi:hypothetical protein D3C75_1151700 [compost metagenome]